MLRQDGNLRKLRKPAEGIFFSSEQEAEGFSFDIEREMTPERVHQILEKLAEYRDEGEWGKFMYIAPPLPSLIATERIPQELFDEKTFGGLVSQLRSSGFTNIPLLRTLYHWYPERSSEFPSDMYIEGQKKEYEQFKRFGMQQMYDHAYPLYLFAPQQRQELGLTVEFFDKANNHVKEEQERALGNRGKPFFLAFNNARFINEAARIALLFPDNKQQLPLDHRTSTFARAYLEEESSREGGEWNHFVSVAESLAILAADRVEIPAPGQLQFVQRKLYKENSLPPQKEY